MYAGLRPQHGESDSYNLQRALPENGTDARELEVGKTLDDSVKTFTCCSPNYSIHLDTDYDVIVFPNAEYGN